MSATAFWRCVVLATALVPGTAVALPRLGVDVGVQWSEFTQRASTTASFPDAPYRLPGVSGGVCGEWRVRGRLAVATALRYESWGAGQQFTLAPFDGLPSTTIETELQELTLAPTARVSLGHGFGLSAGPELAYLLRALRRVEPGVSPAASKAPRRSEGTIFEQAGTLSTREVTSQYQRWLMAFGFGAAWEHRVGRSMARGSIEYRRMLQEPHRLGGEQMATWRMGLTVFP